MKRIFGISLFACLASTILFARTPQEAANIASQFIQQSQTAPIQRMQRATSAISTQHPVQLVYTKYQADNTPAVFVFNDLQSDGFVMVSAEDNARTILGYSDHESFDYTDIPENMQFWLTMYANELTRAKTMTSHIGIRRVGGAINDPLPNIEPILGETIWGQGKPFNNLCPIINGERSVAGCVATAISQIMYAHKHPKMGIGSNSYNIGKEIHISEDFSQTTYDWEQMLPSYKKQYTEAEANAVATLMYHTGVASFMSYHPQGSGAVSEWGMQALNRHFGYDAAVQPLLKDYLPEYDILTVVAKELQEGRPIYVSGRTANDEGHAFVCDGIHADGYVHINWGWDGSGNGFYALSALDPGQHGTGGSSSNLAFTEEVTLYTNIRPDQGGISQPFIYARATQKSNHRIARNDKVTYYIENIGDAGTADISGYAGYYIYDNQHTLVESISLQRIKLRPGYIYTEMNLSSTIANKLPNGEYYLVIACEDEQQNQYPILLHGQGYPQYSFTLTSDSIFFDVKDIQPPTTMQVDYINLSGSQQWQMDLYSPEFWDTTAQDEWLIRCTFTSNSNTSIIGSYQLSKTNNTPGHINLAGAVCAIGNANDCKQHTVSDIQLTFTEQDSAQISIQYSLTFNGQNYQGLLQAPTTHWYQEQNGEYQDYTNAITYQVATPIEASKAIALSRQYAYPQTSPIEYLVAGGVAMIHQTPEEIIEQQAASFDISDDSDIANTLACTHMLWLNNDLWTTGEELHACDTVIALGKLSFVDNTPQLQGYVYQHFPSIQMPITDFQFSLDGMQMTASWESDAPYFKLRLYDKRGKVIADNIIDKKTITAKMPEKGEYTFYLRPMLSDKKQFAGAAIIEGFVAGTSTDIESITENTRAIVYDIMGNQVGVVKNGNIHQLNLLDKGIYIIIDSKNSKKIIIQ